MSNGLIAKSKYPEKELTPQQYFDKVLKVIKEI